MTPSPAQKGATMTLQRVDEPTGTLAEQAYARLLDRLVLLEIAPGEVIREQALAVELGCGRTPLREALKILERDQLIVTYPRRGTFAAPLTLTDLSVISDMRAALDPLASRRGAELRGGDQREALQDLRDQLLELRAADHEKLTPRELIELDLHTHRVLYAAPGEALLEQTLLRLLHLVTRMWCAVLDRVPDVEQHVQEHLDLLDAVLTGEPDRAAELSAEHVRHFEDVLRSNL